MSATKYIAEMLQDREDRGDFRDAAARESRRIIGERAGVPPEDLGYSLCYPAGPDGKAMVKRATGSSTLIQGIILLSAMVFFVLALAFGVAWYFKLGAWAMPATILCGVGLAVAVGMMVLSAVNVDTTREMNENIKELLPQRQYAPHRAQAGLETFAVSLEDHATGDSFHIYSDDLGILVLDKDGKRVIIEGVSHRYVIHGGDFESISPYKTDGSSVRSKVLLTYRVGKEKVQLQIWMFDLLEGVDVEEMSQVALPRTEAFCAKVRGTIGGRLQVEEKG